MHELVSSASLSGTIRIDGIDIYRSDLLITDIRRRIGMVFQKPNPFPAMTVAENVVAGLKLGGKRLSRNEAREMVRECLERAGLWNEVKNRLGAAGGALSVRRAATASLHREGARGAPRRAAHGRAVLRTRPHVDAPHRGDDRRAA
jgi:ABC-type phosphate transport system ATPase subunit